jgi:hypothetical protein
LPRHDGVVDAILHETPGIRSVEQTLGVGVVLGEEQLDVGAASVDVPPPLPEHWMAGMSGLIVLGADDVAQRVARP